MAVLLINKLYISYRSLLSHTVRFMCITAMMQPCFSGGSGWLFSKTFFLAVASCSSVHSTLSLMVRNPHYPKATWHTKTLSILKYLKIWHFHSDWWWVVSRCNKICKVLWHVAWTFLNKSLLHVKDVLYITPYLDMKGWPIRCREILGNNFIDVIQQPVQPMSRDYIVGEIHIQLMLF